MIDEVVLNGVRDQSDVPDSTRDEDAFDLTPIAFGYGMGL